MRDLQIILQFSCVSRYMGCVRTREFALLLITAFSEHLVCKVGWQQRTSYIFWFFLLPVYSKFCHIIWGQLEYSRDVSHFAVEFITTRLSNNSPSPCYSSFQNNSQSPSPIVSYPMCEPLCSAVGELRNHKRHRWKILTARISDSWALPGMTT